MPLSFPSGLWPSRVLFDLEMMSRSGGQSITGSEQVVVSNAGRWRASLAFSLRTRSDVLNWRAFRAGLDGRARRLEVSPFDHHRPLDLQSRKQSAVERVGFAGKSFFSDGTAFDQAEQVYAVLAASAALGATRLSLTVAADWMAPAPGQYFGIGGRLHIVTAAWRVTPADPYLIEFRPGLRAAAAAGAAIVTDHPVCTMRLAQDDSGALDLTLGRFAEINLDMVEAF